VLTEDAGERRKSQKRRAKAAGADAVAAVGEDVVPARLSRKILDVARAQQAEISTAIDASGVAGRAAKAAAFSAAADAVADSTAASRALAASSLAAGGRFTVADDDLTDEEEEEGLDEEEEEELGGGKGGRADASFAIGGETGELALEAGGEYVVHSSSKEDVDLFNRLLASTTGRPGTAIAAAVDARVREAEAARSRARGGGASVGGASALAELGFSPKVIRVFGDVAAFLAHYRAGKLPKVMKILPGMAGWEDLLSLTGPDRWTPHAFYAVSRVFASNLNDVRAQRFFNLYLLPAVRNDVSTNHKLNYHLYQALRKALYKPAAWYKGILLPLASSGDCTLREATIVASVLTTRRVPPLQSAAAVYKLATMRYSPAISVFLRVLLSKKYALPLRVVDAVSSHFAGFATIPSPLPVLWHQSFLAFAQHYGPSTTQAQRDSLKPTLTSQVHRAITPEVRRELFASPPRGLAVPSAAAAAAASSSSSSSIRVISAGADVDM